MTDSSLASYSNIDQSNESEKYIECQSDCSHCNKEEIKQNSDLLALQTQLNASKKERWDQKANVFERSYYEINQNDSQYDLLKDKVKILNDRSLDLDDIEIGQLSPSRKQRKLNADEDLQLINQKAVIDMGRVLASVDKQLQREKEESKKQSFVTSPACQLQNLSFGKDQKIQQSLNQKERSSQNKFQSAQKFDQINIERNQRNNGAETIGQNIIFKKNENCDVHGVLLGSGCKYCYQEQQEQDQYRIFMQEQDNEMDKITQSLRKVNINELQGEFQNYNRSNQVIEQTFKFQNDNTQNFESFGHIQDESKKRKYYEISQDASKLNGLMNQNILTNNHIENFYQKMEKNIDESRQFFKPKRAIIDYNRNNFNDSQNRRLMDTQSQDLHLSSNYQSFRANEEYLRYQLLQDYKDSEQDSDVVIQSQICRYWLNKKSVDILLNKFKLNDEIINAYTNLLSIKRQFHPENQKYFHLFNSMFSLKLSYLIDTNTYNFMNFAQYFDKQHYLSPKNVTNQSIMIFVINNEEDDYVLIVVDIQTQQFIIYDPIIGRQKETFLLHVKKIKKFLSDYFNCFMPKKIEDLQSSQIEQQQDIEDLMSFKSGNHNSNSGNELYWELELDRVEQWIFTSGSCLKISDQDFQRNGSGIYITWYLDQITQCLIPQRSQQFTPNEIKEEYSKISVELLTSQPLCYC